jgi:hypothetical protein
MSSIICSSSVGVTQAAFGILRVCYVSWLHQHSETNVMHFLFNLLRIKGLYMFRTLHACLQEAINKRHLVLQLQPW